MNREGDEYVDSEESGFDTNNEFVTAIAESAVDFNNALKQKLSKEAYKKILTIGAFIVRGLSLEESCILAMISKEKFERIMNKDEDVKQFIIFKQIQFKAGLLNTLSASAIAGGQARSAGYLLEKKFPKEFDVKKGDDPEKKRDIVQEAIDYVREHSIDRPLVLTARTISA